MHTVRGLLTSTFWQSLVGTVSQISCFFSVHSCLGTILQTGFEISVHFLVGKGKHASLWTIPQFFLGQDLHFSFGTHVSRGSDLQRGTTSLWHSCRGVCVQIFRGSSWHNFSYLILMIGTAAFTWWPFKPLSPLLALGPLLNLAWMRALVVALN